MVYRYIVPAGTLIMSASIQEGKRKWRDFPAYGIRTDQDWMFTAMSICGAISEEQGNKVLKEMKENGYEMIWIDCSRGWRIRVSLNNIKELGAI